MPIIEWRDDFKTGDASVDHEHQELIELLNTLYDSMVEGPPADDTVRGLGEVFVRISAHFALEEREMREAKYADYPAHKDDHEDLLDQIRDIMDAYEVGVFGDQRDAFGDNLQNWFVNHFKTHDAKLHRVFGH
ncbi:MAG: hemerythrin family protein [Rhodospirillaceae bacterium]|mgnify:CR=1 FL=1|jgi:hemerythrin|nr:hemerythrin family protein [Rhodospirillaceae bacterium]